MVPADPSGDEKSFPGIGGAAGLMGLGLGLGMLTSDVAEDVE